MIKRARDQPKEPASDQPPTPAGDQTPNTAGEPPPKPVANQPPKPVGGKWRWRWWWLLVSLIVAMLSAWLASTLFLDESTAPYELRSGTSVPTANGLDEPR